MNANQFSDAMRKDAKKVVARSAEAIRSMTLVFYHDVQTDVKGGSGHGSPIASGRFAASMRLSLNQIDASTAPADEAYVYDRDNLHPRTIANRPISAIAATLRQFKLGDTIWISNSVPYVRKIEVGGHSWQAPDGVFGPTARKIAVQFADLNVLIKETP